MSSCGGGRIRTYDLWVMSPTSYYCSTPRCKQCGGRPCMMNCISSSVSSVLRVQSYDDFLNWPNIHAVFCVKKSKRGKTRWRRHKKCTNSSKKCSQTWQAKFFLLISHKINECVQYLDSCPDMPRQTEVQGLSPGAGLEDT